MIILLEKLKKLIDILLIWEGSLLRLVYKIIEYFFYVSSDDL